MYQETADISPDSNDPLFADLHNHVVPGVDDGSRSLDESHRSLRAFRDEGIRTLIATPHLYLQFLDGPRELAGRLEQLRRAYDQLADSIRGADSMPSLYYGQEICAHGPDSARRVVDEPGVGLGNTPFMLIEFGFELEGDPEAVIQTVREAGREIVVAHPERYRFPAGDDPIARMRGWRDAGAYLQVNLGSLYDRESAYGGDAERLGWELLDEGLAHIVSSDHHCDSRPQILHRTIHRAIQQRGGLMQADLLLAENPRRIIEGLAPLEVPGLCGAAGGR